MSMIDKQRIAAVRTFAFNGIEWVTSAGGPAEEAS
jgi:hypothetical protein